MGLIQRQGFKFSIVNWLGILIGALSSLADIVLGNLHQKVVPQSKYGKSKESGLLFTMIKAAKPGILPADYPCEPALQSSVLYFNDYSAAEKLLLQLAQERTSLTLLKENAIVNSNFYTPQNVLSRLESSSL